MSKIRVLIVDDQKLFAGSLKVVLEGHGDGEIDVVGIAYNGLEALDLVGPTNPDVVLMDVRMPEMDGVEATREIHRLHPEIKIMILTTFADDDYVMNALSGGAAGYVLKSIEPDELVTSVKAVYGGTVLMSASVGQWLIKNVGSGAPGGQLPSERDTEIHALIERFPDLGRREAEVLHLMCENLDNREIADALFVAEQTIKNYTSKIYTKLGVDDRPHAIQMVKRVRGGG